LPKRRAQNDSMRGFSAAGQAAAVEYKGQTIYFCAKGCKAKFDQDPGKYTFVTGGSKGPETARGERR